MKEGGEMQKLYQELKEADVLSPIKHLIDAGYLPPMTPDGVIHTRYMLDFNEMWIHSKHDIQRRCGIWHKVWFNCYKFIPRGCRNCWKVTFKPKGLEDAFKVMELQRVMDLPAKVGMERRPFTGAEGGFSAFWYAPLDGGLRGGRKLHEKVKREVRKTFPDSGYKPILKRGCTEMESRFSPSSAWDELAKQYQWDRYEALISSIFVMPIALERQPMPMKVRNMAAWIEWGFEHSGVSGDKSYRKYIEEDPVPQLEHYHDSIHSEKDFESDWEGKNEPNNNRLKNAKERIESWLGPWPEYSEDVYRDDREDGGGSKLEKIEGLASA